MTGARGILIPALLASALAQTSGAELRLTQEGITRYRIVRPANPSPVDDYAARELAGYLKQITGAELSVVGPDDLVGGAPSIFIGLSTPALERRGPNPLAGLEEEGHVARSIGPDIFLYGKSPRGNLYAVMEFLENSLGWRWYSVFDRPALPSRPTVSLEPFDRNQGFSFKYREIVPYYGYDYYYQQGANMTYAWVQSSPRWEQIVAAGIMPARGGSTRIGGAHSLHQYIPPTPDQRLWPQYEWIDKRDYFKTNPEFFSMARNGQRVPSRQLCFANRGLRDELTRRVMQHVDRRGENAVITIGAEDVGEKYCECPECVKLEEKYQSPGGAYFDYLIELSHRLKEREPTARLKGVAYRRIQSQNPPVLPDGVRFADNFIILFAPIEDPYLGDWSQPDPGLRETYSNLVAWAEMASESWVYYYPNPYGTGQVMPVGNVGRFITALRMMHEAGVTGIFMEHGSGVLEGGNFTELLAALFFHLTRDIECDTDAVIREFTDHQYGPAGELVRTYLAELEQGRKAIKVMPRGMRIHSSAFSDGNWPYLTPDNIRRWQGYFDRMETLTAAQPTQRANVQRLRRNLEFAALFRWFDLQEAYPDYFHDYEAHAERIRKVNADKREDLVHQPRPLGEQQVRNLVSAIHGGGEKPLPDEFAGIDRSRIRTFMPENRAGGTQGMIDDPHAAFGYAPSVHKPDAPFTLGFYQGDTRIHGPRLTIDNAQITPGEFRLYRLGTIALSPDCRLWFGRSWGLIVDLDELWDPGAANKWDAYVSIRFQGPAYGGKPVEGLRYGEVDLVLVDRVILVKTEAPE